VVYKGVGMEEMSESKVRFYLSQADVAQQFNTTPRMLLYWENQGLIHPDTKKDPQGKSRKYTQEDLLEIKFIKGLIDEGYTTTALKKKLEGLKPPYRCDLNGMLWDYRDKVWRTRKELGREYLREEFKKMMGTPDPFASMINYIFDLLEGKQTQ